MSVCTIYGCRYILILFFIASFLTILVLAHVCPTLSIFTLLHFAILIV